MSFCLFGKWQNELTVLSEAGYRQGKKNYILSYCGWQTLYKYIKSPYIGYESRKEADIERRKNMKNNRVKKKKG